MKFEGAGVLNLGGSTLSNADIAVACDRNCIVRNGALTRNPTNVAGARVKLTDVAINAVPGASNFGVLANKGAKLQNVTISHAPEAVRSDAAQ